jgi:hypothetical protein
MKSPTLYKISGKVGRVAQKPLRAGGMPGGLVGSIPGPLGRLDEVSRPATAGAKSFRERWKEGI